MFPTGGDKEVWAEIQDVDGQTARDYKIIYAIEDSLLLTGALEVNPIQDYYYIGDTLTTTFTIKNKKKWGSNRFYLRDI